MITISVRKHLNVKLRPIFAILHRLECVSNQSFVPKQGGECGSGVSRKEDPKNPNGGFGLLRKEDPNALTKPIIKQELKGKEKLFSEEPVIDNREDEEELDDD
ncbi:unnamed protein product [Lactuca saligna]|uniref:Uncharacterized protein n=1 Tax=Lactuca saligna TaxID=75948 RepID=A0AA36A397_LACSI|nr:unnamed protein product [Lactuca saligna]